MHILGPKLEDNTQHCKLQLYYQFRVYLKSPMQEKDFCDRNIIRR